MPNNARNSNKTPNLQGVTNTDFLQAVFGGDWETAHVTNFSNDPSDIPQELRAACWSGGFARDRLPRMSAGENQYFTISTFEPTPDHRSKRRKALFDACFVIVADDVNEKVPVERAELLPEPSYKLLTSAGSEQWGWILSSPEEDRGRVNALLDGLVSQGLAPDGVDPGMKGVTRYVRLPGGSNTKAKRYVNGEAFKCRLLTWQPELQYVMEDLADAFAIDLDAGADDGAVFAGVSGALATRHPIFDHVRVTGEGNENWTQIDCPNGAAHTGGDLSGAAVQIQEDGRVHFQCHHGHCSGGDGAPKMTGPKIIGLLDKAHPGLMAACDAYCADIKVAGMAALVDKFAVGLELGGGEDLDRLLSAGADADERVEVEGMNPNDYFFMKNTGTYYEKATGTEMTAKTFDTYWLQNHTGAKGDPKASVLYAKVMNRDTMSADGFLWYPDKIQPTGKRMIKHGGCNMINEWSGLSLSPVEGDVSLWLDLLTFLLPDEKERQVVLQWMANMVLDVGDKPCWQVIHRGKPGVGKDSLYKPLMMMFGPAGGDVTSEDIADGWGNVFHHKKFLQFQEIYQPQNRSFSDMLKKYAASTGDDMMTVNIKGQAQQQQVNVLGFVGMSNRHNCMAIDQDDRRYFVVDSFVQEPKPEEYYTRYRAWLAGGGAAAVLYYLLNDVDMTGFSAHRRPWVTDACRELMVSSRPDYEQAIEEMIDEGRGIFALEVMTLGQVADYMKSQGHKMGRAGLADAMRARGYHQHRGARRVAGESKKTPRFLTREALPSYSARETYDYYGEALDRQSATLSMIAPKD